MLRPTYDIAQTHCDDSWGFTFIGDDFTHIRLCIKVMIPNHITLCYNWIVYRKIEYSIISSLLSFIHFFCIAQAIPISMKRCWSEKCRLMKDIRCDNGVCLCVLGTACCSFFALISEYSIPTCCVRTNWKIQFEFGFCDITMMKCVFTDDWTA